MDYSSRLSISYYNTIATINESHKIYLVRHPQTNRIYVKKILDVFSAPVYEEIKNTQIAGIPKIIEYCEDNDTLIVIEEFINGDALSDIIQKYKLTADDITGYILSLCDTVERLHSLQPPVIHRDIKPSNIIIDRYGKPILIDFNAAKNYTRTASKDTVLLGTEGYAAPEQYGFGASSPQTDIYSIGILLKELVKALNVPTNQFDPIIQCCTQINPNDRYPSVKELKAALTHFQPKEDKPSKPDKHYDSYLLPGFRSGKFWKIFVALPVYIFALHLSLTLQVENISGLALWVERLTCIVLFLVIVFSIFNYRNIQRHFPFHNNPNRIVRYIGVWIALSLMIFSIFSIMVILVNIASHLT